MAPRGNYLGAVQRTKTTPIPVQRTTRTLAARVLTSLPAGKMVPIHAIPLLREDSLAGGNYRLAFEMSETVELLMNSVNVRCMAYFVPKLAFNRYSGFDELNRSYNGLPEADGTTTPWFDMRAFEGHDINKIAYHLGIHARVGQMVNTDYTSAYNEIWNFRAQNRSKDLALRNNADVTLAPAFWHHQTFAHIVPDFDQALIDGEVALSVTPVGAGVNTKAQVLTDRNAWAWRQDTTGAAILPGDGHIRSAPDSSGRMYTEMNAKYVYADPGLSLTAEVGAVFNEMIEAGVTVSLSNIELARKTQAFANLRRQYSGLTDENLIDMLMSGLTIPDEMWRQPILLADVSTVFGMSKRYASDGASLTESVVNGVTYVDIRFNVPRCSSGGVVMIVAEIAPEQLFERQKDPYWTASTVAELPDFLRDTLDPEKVQVVTNEEIDISHNAPTGTFGYAPLNHAWAKSRPNIGGKFLRPTVDEAFDEDRQRIWAVETANPTLSQDFYLVSDIHYKPFVVTDLAIDPFECLMRGQCSIGGLTVFGGLLVEGDGEYDAVMAEAPQDRIDLPDAATNPASVSPAE